ncbi:SAM-dependent methyltransferase [Amycolatopsis sp. NPDC059657]|uniref:SAM-dependent methyltransferase n=1 Tax=Amycolatopsis sp. NPDC059657 TaxID=3346899 RepID=UPI00366C77D5
MNRENPPAGIDLDRPNAARAYDWAIGGTANWAIDRQYGEKALAAYPQLRQAARANRAFLGRAVRYCVENGVTQFLDLGSGIPTMGNVHEIADELDPESRCVYVDIEPVAVAHARILLEEEGDPDRHAVVHADLCNTREVWKAALETGVLDPDKPIGLLTVAVLHFVPDETGVAGSIRAYRDLLPVGSLYVISHLTDSEAETDTKSQLQQLKEVSKRSSTPGVLRSTEEVRAFFGDFELVEPGLVPVGDWHPDDLGSTPRTAIGGVARKVR